MIGTIRKHQTWLWMVIVTLTIISFVIFFSPYSKMNSGARSGNYGSINGERISEGDYANAYREVQLHYLFSSGRWPDEDTKKSGFDPMRETYQWLLLMQKENELAIHVTSDDLAQTARARLRAFENMGVDSPRTFVTQILEPHGLSMADFERYCRHSFGLQQLVATVGLSGRLVTPQEAKEVYEREHQELATEALFFNASNYLAGVTVTPEALLQYYTNAMPNYRIPERVQVNYAKYDLSNYLAQAETELKTNLTEMVDASYQRYGTNLFPETKTPAETKAKIREQLIRQQAIPAARKQALGFANTLMDMNERQALTPESLQSLARTNGLAFGSTAPFDRESGPAGIEGATEFIKAAFALTSQYPVSGAVTTHDAVYVLVLAKRLPSENPPFDQIRDRVAADYKYRQATTMARQQGQAYYSTVTNGLAQKKTFDTICTEAKLKPVPLPPFSISTRSLPDMEEQVNLNQLKQAAFSTPPGKVSGLVLTADGGLLLFVESMLPIDQAKMQADMPAFVNYVRRSRLDEAFQDWFRREADKGLRDTPAFQQQRPPPAMAAGGSKS